MVMKRDKVVDLMLSFGILFVVMGHNYQLPWLFFPAYTFHIPLFFFISGFLFKPLLNLNSKLKFVVKKLKTQFIPYMIFNFIFFFITIILQKHNIFMQYEFTPFMLFVNPFFSGAQSPFIIPLWFLMQLFILNLIFQFIYWKDSKGNTLILSGLIFLLGVICAYFGLNKYQGIILLIVRTGICMVFYQMGILTKLFKSKLDTIVINPLFIATSYILIALANNFGGRLDYAVIWGNVNNQLFFLPILTSCIIIYVVYGICKIVSQYISEESIFVIIGRSSFWIMSMHLCGFFFLNFIFFKIGLVAKSQLSDIYFNYNILHTFLLYYLFGISFGLIAAKCANFIKAKKQILFQKINNANGLSI